ncbi:hypothetical protein [Alteromonas oceanisediminis]|uniref:hypothetical protein n=1 Tax=Alteromonas oceanisediminis TaxID=2836180 RepID=UPI001BD9629C|nr:hypothetical protein [Alteromonas oceanisediminis]MBT0585605.1 hypothetical protein [Alteromonas oceanisediminis]
MKKVDHTVTSLSDTNHIMQMFSGKKGSFQLNRNGNVVELIALGQWDEALARAFLSGVEQLVKPLNGRSWATIVDVREWELGTPEFQEIITDGTQLQVAMGLRREAYIIDASQVKIFQIDAMMPPDPLYSARYFQQYGDGLAWLADEGFGG